MAYSKKVYLTKVVGITKTMAGEQIAVQVPYLSTVKREEERSLEDPFYWDVVYDEAGMTSGIHTTAVVGIFCDETDHDVLESDPDIILVE